jgi:membrane protease YdiL (CAAX protease family)
VPDFHLDYEVLRDWLILTAVLALPLAGLLWTCCRQRRGLFPPLRRRSVPWTGAEILVAYLIAQVVILLLLDLIRKISVLELFYGPMEAPEDLARIRRGLWAGTLAMPLQLGGIMLFLRAVSGTRPYQLGWTTYRFPQNLAVGIVYWLVLMPAILLLNILVQRVLELITRTEPEPHAIQKLMERTPLPADWVMVVLTALAAAPVLEEFLYRGVLLPWLAMDPRRNDVVVGLSLAVAVLARLPGLEDGAQQLRRGADAWTRLHSELQPAYFILAMLPVYLGIRWAATRPGPVPAEPIPAGDRAPASGFRVLAGDSLRSAPAIFSSALLFAIWHSEAWPSPIPLLPLGIVLGWLAWRTRSLTASIVVHVLFNAVAVLGLVHQEGKPPPKGRDATSAVCPLPGESTSRSVPGASHPRRR